MFTVSNLKTINTLTDNNQLYLLDRIKLIASMKINQILNLINLPKTGVNKIIAQLIVVEWGKFLHPQPVVKEIPIDFILAKWESLKPEAIRINKRKNYSYESEWCDKNTNGDFAYNNVTDDF